MIFFLENIFLFLFFFIGILSSFFVIFCVNPVHSVLFLILVFFNISGLLMLLGLEYFALVFIIIYIGAIAVLFLFIVMMLNIKIIEIRDNFWRYMPVGFFLTFIFILEIFILISADSSILIINRLDYINYVNWINYFDNIFNLEIIGQILYTYYFFAFLIGGLILFLAMFGSILLTLNQSQTVRRQKVYKQILRDSSSIILKKSKN